MPPQLALLKLLRSHSPRSNVSRIFFTRTMTLVSLFTQLSDLIDAMADELFPFPTVHNPMQRSHAVQPQSRPLHSSLMRQRRLHITHKPRQHQPRYRQLLQWGDSRLRSQYSRVSSSTGCVHQVNNRTVSFLACVREAME